MLDFKFDTLTHKEILLYTGTFAAICGHYALLLMLQDQVPASGLTRASWKAEEVDALIEYLLQHRSEGGDGGTFKKATYNRLAVHLAPFLKAGPAKTGDMCKGKWNSVRIAHYHPIVLIIPR